MLSLRGVRAGYGGGTEGWWAELTNGTNTQAACYAFGQYLGNRYASRSNIVWVFGGDFVPPANSEGETRLLLTDTPRMLVMGGAGGTRP